MNDEFHEGVRFEALTLEDMRFLAEELAFAVQCGDVITLRGDLGAGKTTFARAFICALMGDACEEVPSPTYTLVQHYDSPRCMVGHYDLYRLSDPSEFDELGLEHALEKGVALIEWPERAQDRLPENLIEVTLDDYNNTAQDNDTAPEMRSLTLTGYGTWRSRLNRFVALRRAIQKADFDGRNSHIYYLQGDASVRRYARLVSKKRNAIVMDWPAQVDGPNTRKGQSYSDIAHLAEDVGPFLGVGRVLKRAGFSAPAIYSEDAKHGIVVLEDLGDQVLQKIIENGNEHSSPSQEEMWTASVDVLIELRGVPIPDMIPVKNGVGYRLPDFDRKAMMIEVELLIDWYLPMIRQGSDEDEHLHNDFVGVWNNLLDGLLERQNMSEHSAELSRWVLRDYHSPNLIWLAEREADARVGLIDFQDALRGPAAYDLVSLLQDARVNVSPELETRLFNYYCTEVQRHEPDFDRTFFEFSYAVLGAQRSTKILGIFARLAERDQKPHYLAHIPRVWRYLERNLGHQELTQLRSWYDQAIPKRVREKPLHV